MPIVYENNRPPFFSGEFRFVLISGPSWATLANILLKAFVLGNSEGIRKAFVLGNSEGIRVLKANRETFKVFVQIINLTIDNLTTLTNL